MNEIVNKFLLTVDKFMFELHLTQPEFIYRACGHRERIQKFKETRNLKYIYKNRLDKACFAHDAAYADSKDLATRTVSDMNFKDRAYKIAINSKHDGYQIGFARIQQDLQVF